MLMLSRNALQGIESFGQIELGGLQTLSLYANSIEGDLLASLEMLNRSCPKLENLNIEANPFVDKV